MKAITSIIILLAPLLSLKAQTKLFGKFKYCTDNKEHLAFNYVLDLNCDKTFIMHDSATSSTVIGTWNLRNDKELILSIDTTKLKSEISTKQREWKYIVEATRLYEKPISKAQYNKQSKRLNNSLSKETGESSHFEDYQTFKAKQENRYLLKIENFNCP